MQYFIANTEAAAQEIENMIYALLVTEDGLNFKAPFLPGTLTYFSINDYINQDSNRRALPITDHILALAESNQTVANLIQNPLTAEELNQEGFSIEIN